MKKKYLIALLCGVLCVSALTGCQNSPAKEEEASAPELSLEPSQEQPLQDESSTAAENSEGRPEPYNPNPWLEEYIPEWIKEEVQSTDEMQAELEAMDEKANELWYGSYPSKAVKGARKDP